MMHGAGKVAGRVIIRHNVVYDNTRGVDLVERGWRAYNNTFVNDNRDFEGPERLRRGEPMFSAASLRPTAGTDFFNNIAVDHTHAAYWLSGRGAGHVLDNNLYFDTAGDLVFGHGQDGDRQTYGFDDWQDFLAEEMPGAEQHSLVADPAFRDVPVHPVLDYRQPDPPDRRPAGHRRDRLVEYFPYDFRLTARSPSVDAGAT